MGPVTDRLRAGIEVPRDIDTVHHFCVQRPVDRVGVIRQIEPPAVAVSEDLLDLLLGPIDSGCQAQTWCADKNFSLFYRLLLLRSGVPWGPSRAIAILWVFLIVLGQKAAH